MEIAVGTNEDKILFYDPRINSKQYSEIHVIWS